MARFLDKHIDSLRPEINQREIATAMGFQSANIISMFKTGETRVPLDKMPALAKAINVDPAHLMRLGLEQYWPGQMRTINEIFQNLVTRTEMEIIEVFRSASADRDAPMTEHQNQRLREIFTTR